MLFIVGCLYWLKLQPYSIPEHLLPSAFPVGQTLWELVLTFLDAPLLLFPIVALFLPEIRRCSRRSTVLAGILFLGYLVLAIYPSHLRGDFPLEPMSGAIGEWVNPQAIFGWLLLKERAPVVLGTGVRVVLTAVSFGGWFGMMCSLLHHSLWTDAGDASSDFSRVLGLRGVSWRQLGVLLVPFSVAYGLLLLPRSATSGLRDRYLLGLLPVALLCMIRYYQERIHLRMPQMGVLLVGAMAIYSACVVHDMFSIYRARVELAAELRSDGVSDSSVDNGWEYNFGAELHYADHINERKIAVPANAYLPRAPQPAGMCAMNQYDKTPHIFPLYGVSFDPDACYGMAPFAPVHYSRWLGRKQGTLYAVYYFPPSERVAAYGGTSRPATKR